MVGTEDQLIKACILNLSSLIIYIYIYAHRIGRLLVLAFGEDSVQNLDLIHPPWARDPGPLNRGNGWAKCPEFNKDTIPY